jgi:hypothetical protein
MMMMMMLPRRLLRRRPRRQQQQLLTAAVDGCCCCGGGGQPPTPGVMGRGPPRRPRRGCSRLARPPRRATPGRGGRRSAFAGCCLERQTCEARGAGAARRRQSTVASAGRVQGVCRACAGSGDGAGGRAGGRADARARKGPQGAQARRGRRPPARAKSKGGLTVTGAGAGGQAKDDDPAKDAAGQARI